MKHIRTIAETANWVKQQDPDSALTKTAIRSLVIHGILPSNRIGDKYLIALEALDTLVENATMLMPSAGTHDKPCIRHLRTIEGAAAWIKVYDPGTSLTASAIRRLVKQGILPSLAIRSKRLVALEALEELLNGSDSIQSVPQGDGIRRIHI